MRKWHEDYGLPIDHRETVLTYADNHGITAAVKRFNVSLSTLYRWRKYFKISTPKENT